MGIKGLSSFVKSYGTIKKMSDYSGLTVAIDAPIYMFKFKYLSTTEQFINNFKTQISLFKKHNISPIYIFDGKHPKEKQETREARKKTQTIFITEEDNQLLRELFNESGVRWVTAPSEAEKLCSYFSKIGKVDFAMSNDYDTFVFGCKKLLVYSKNEYVEYLPETILEDLNLSRNEFLEISIASGCDFYPSGIPGIGIKKGLKLVEKGKKIEDWGATQEFLDILPTIKNIFTDFTEEERVEIPKISISQVAEQVIIQH